MTLLLLIPPGCCDFRHHVQPGREEEEEKRWAPRHIGLTKSKTFPRNLPAGYLILHWHHYPRWRGRLGNQHSEEDEGYYVWLRPVASYCLGLGRHGNITGGWGCAWDEWAQPGWGSLYPPHAPILLLPSQMTLVFWIKGRASLLWLLRRWSGDCFSALGLRTSLRSYQPQTGYWGSFFSRLT